MSVNATPFRPRGWVPKVLQKGSSDSVAPTTSSSTGAAEGAVEQPLATRPRPPGQTEDEMKRPESETTAAHGEAEIIFRESDWPHLSDSAAAVPVSTDATVGSDTSSFGPTRGLSNSGGSSEVSSEGFEPTEQQDQQPAVETDDNKEPEPIPEREEPAIESEDFQPYYERDSGPNSAQSLSSSAPPGGPQYSTQQQRRSREYTQYNMMPNPASMGRSYMFPPPPYLSGMPPAFPQYNMPNQGMFQQPAYQSQQQQQHYQAQQPQQIPQQRPPPISHHSQNRGPQHHAPHHHQLMQETPHSSSHGITMHQPSTPASTPSSSGRPGDDESPDVRTQAMIEMMMQRMDHFEFVVSSNMASFARNFELVHQRLDGSLHSTIGILNLI
jgi:hypothetical protein